MNGTGPVRRPSSRVLGIVCAGLGVSAALLWGASAVVPVFSGTVLPALAGVAAVVATGGVVRRALGGLLGVAGAVVAVLAVATPLAVAGGVALFAVGVFVAVREPLLPRFGARYAGVGTPKAALDPDRAAWQDLDAGRDPTADAPPGSQS